MPKLEPDVRIWSWGAGAGPLLEPQTEQKFQNCSALQRWHKMLLKNDTVKDAWDRIVWQCSKSFNALTKSKVVLTVKIVVLKYIVNLHDGWTTEYFTARTVVLVNICSCQFINLKYQTSISVLEDASLPAWVYHASVCSCEFINIKLTLTASVAGSSSV